mmetsp:Transcript_66657/g.168890  ORF Transcript_66657/g.168890 Transcript_66657/m.168890 type:complete len:174 (+) Transcript_66657:64-585(+)
MGCGAAHGHKYEADSEVSASLKNLGDDSRGSRAGGTQPQGKGAGKGKPAGGSQSSREGGSLRYSAHSTQSDRYAAGGIVEGFDIVEGDVDVSAVATANDPNLLWKYGQSDAKKGKKRPGGAVCVFAPSSGPRSGEPLAKQSQKVDDSPASFPDYLTMPSNKVGELKLHHHPQR